MLPYKRREAPKCADNFFKFKISRTCSGCRLCGPQVRITRSLSTIKSSLQMKYQLPRLDKVEDVEKYREGGFHPIYLGDSLNQRRYKVLHKLGYGGFSTVWLARDEDSQKLVSLKVLSAAASRNDDEGKVLQYLDRHAGPRLGHNNLISVSDAFTIEGPNGLHRCHVSRVEGPSIAQLSDCPGQPMCSRRLRGPLARKLAKQLVAAVLCLHSAGIIHGGKDLPSCDMIR
jgi:serine/threonine-protein kinase SRPK3